MNPRPIAVLVLIACCYFGVRAHLAKQWGPFALSATVALAALVLLIRRRGPSPGASTSLPRWVEVGSVGPRYREELAVHATKVLATVGRRGQLSKLFIVEPTPGAFGRARQEFSANVLAALDTLIEGQSVALMMTPSGYAPVDQPMVTPEVVQALEDGHGFFLIGTDADGSRKVGFVMVAPESEAR